MQAVDYQFKLLAKLHLVYENIVCFLRIIMALNIIIKGMILFEILIFQIKKINEDDIGIGLSFLPKLKNF